VTYGSQVWALDDTATAWTIDVTGTATAAPIYGPPRANQLTSPYQSWFQVDRTIRDGATATLDVLDTLPTISGYTIPATRADFDSSGNLYVMTADTTLPPGSGNRSVHKWNGSAWSLVTAAFSVSFNHIDARRTGYLLICNAASSTSQAIWLELSGATTATAWDPLTSSGGPGMTGVVNSAIWNGTDGLALFVPVAASRPTYAGIYAFDTANGTSSGPHQFGYTWASTATTYPVPETMVRDQLGGHWLVVRTGLNDHEVVRFDSAGLTVTEGPYDVNPGSPFIDAIGFHGSPLLGPIPEEPTAGGIFLARGVLGAGAGLVLG